VRSVARSLVVGSPRVSVNHGSRYLRGVIFSVQLLGLGGEKRGQGFRAGLSAVVTSENEQSVLLVLACRHGLPGGFLVQCFRAGEVARNDLDTPVEVMFEQLYCALDVAIFHGQQ
jgi:hypothetical protein